MHRLKPHIRAKVLIKGKEKATMEGTAIGSAAINDSQKCQVDNFKKLARELEADEAAGRWDERLKKVAKPKPETEKT